MHLRRTTVFEVLAEIVASNDKLKSLCKGQPEAEDVIADISYSAGELGLLCQGQEERINGLELELALIDARARGAR